ncbi:hypothetical protein [Sporomusa aerivorans]|uniref:hypothetical protein n=1 Tax=Sporomusa aerivorans TaxID=204936 RepID=UPI00352AB845
MNSTNTMEQAWNQSFRSVDSLFSGSNTTTVDRIGNGWTTASALEKTYMDSMRVAKANADISKEVEQLNRLMEQNKNSVGNKQLQQTQNDIMAQQNAILLKQQQTMGAMAATVAAQSAQQNQADAEAMALAKKYVEANNANAAKGNPLNSAKWGWL